MHVPDFENNFFIIRLTKSNIPIGSLVGTSPFFYFSDSQQCVAPIWIFCLKKKKSLSLTHTPLEGLSGFGQFPRLMVFTQLFFGISGTQNRKDQNFLTRTFSVIAILRYPTFPYCFYYIAILQLRHFREIFTSFLACSDRMYLESYNFLRLFLTYIPINW